MPQSVAENLVSGLLFTVLYFIYFSSLNMVFPDYVEHI